MWYHITILLTIILALVKSTISGGGSIKINRLPHHWSLVEPPKNHITKIGNSVPMGGGFLTIGAYYSTVEIGEPAQKFNVLIDTGSSNLAVPLLGCNTCGSTNISHFNPTLSRTYQPLDCSAPACLKCSPKDYFNNVTKCAFGQPFCFLPSNACGFGITYGGGSSGISGYVALDQVCLGGYCVEPHNIILITRETPATSFSTVPIDGILGLAYEMNACNPTCTTPIFDHISSAYTLPNIFSMCLTQSNGGILDLATIDPKKYTGTIQYTPITQERWWNIHVEDILIGTTSVQIPDFFYWTTNDVIGGFVDSGTSIFLVAPVIFQAIQNIFQTQYSHLPGVPYSLFNGQCVTEEQMGDQVKNFPNVTVLIPDEKGTLFSLSMPPQSYLMYVNQSYCLGIMGNAGTGIILGDVFMQNYYIVFDKMNGRLGFANLSSCQ